LEDRDYIFGLSKASEVNLNQVLFLLAGKDGEPGAAGRDGINGLNGLDGKDGKDGINGIDGKDGINGINGINGATGATGAAGRDGRDGRDAVGGSYESYTAYSNGLLNFLACTEVATVTLRPKWTGDNFVFEDAGFKDISPLCGDGTKAVTMFFRIGSATLNNTSDPEPRYENNDLLRCVYPIPLISTWGTNPQFTATNEETVCTNITDESEGVFTLNDIYTSDFTNVIGFEIYAR
jgi:hypothetical protein